MKHYHSPESFHSALLCPPTMIDSLLKRKPNLKLSHLGATNRDVIERKRIEQELRIAATAFESQEAMLILDHNKLILRVNHAFTKLSGYSAIDVIGKSTDIFRSGCQDQALYEEIWHQIAQEGFWCGEMHTRNKSGEMHPIWSTLTAVKSSDGAISHYVSTATDMTRRKNAERKIKHLAFYDALTGLANRSLLIDRLQQALDLSRRDGSCGALMFIDLDNFKTLNDTVGQGIGDQLLLQVAQRLSTCVRDGDTVARLGSDDFVIVLTNLSQQPEPAIKLAEQTGQCLLSTLNTPYDLGGQLHYSSPSIGVTLFGSAQETVDDLLCRADLAMYQAKGAGGNALRFFDPAMQNTITARAKLEGAMRHGLEHGKFILYYQPQIAGDGKPIGAEALVRWQHPQHGLLSPSDFIVLAEESGLIVPLGLQVLKLACQQLAEWGACDDLCKLTLSVNVSARQFQQPDFVELVLRTIENTGANSHMLKLELTESLLLDNVEDTISKMLALRVHGVRFSLDDFGTGYSSLSYLKRLPLDQLKIDQSFVHSVLVDANDAAIVRMIVMLGKSMGLNLIAEGVETEEQRIFLAACGCLSYQGYLFGRPMAADSFKTFMRGSICNHLTTEDVI